MSDKPAVPLEELLAHRKWVRSLAVALTRDAADADDVEQEVWLAAVRSPPTSPGSGRSWLGRVARNEVRSRHRSRTRRRAREQVSAAARADTPDPGELAAAAELHASVATAVVRLREPYREAVLLRYFEGMSVREIAAHIKAPVETVKARLRRARALLRERLERAQDDDMPLGVLLAPLTGASAPGRRPVPLASAATLGGLAVSKKSVALVAALLVLTAVAGVVWAARRAGSTAGAGHSAAPSGAPQPETAAVRRERLRSPAPVLPAPAPAAESVPEEAGGGPDLDELLSREMPAIRVLAPSAVRDVLAHVAARSGLPLWIADDSATVVDGLRPLVFFTKPAPARAGLESVLSAASRCYRRDAPHRHPLRYALDGDRIVIYVRAPSDTWVPGGAAQRVEPAQVDSVEQLDVRVQGRVVDELGGPVSNALVVVTRSDAARLVIADRRRAPPSTRSAADGGFALDVGGSGRAVRALVPFRRPGPTVPVSDAPGTRAPGPLTLTVGAPAGALRLTVVDGDGTAVPSARVALGFTDASAMSEAVVDGRLVPGTSVYLQPARSTGEGRGPAPRAGFPLGAGHGAGPSALQRDLSRSSPASGARRGSCCVRGRLPSGCATRSSRSRSRTRRWTLRSCVARV